MEDMTHRSVYLGSFTLGCVKLTVKANWDRVFSEKMQKEMAKPFRGSMRSVIQRIKMFFTPLLEINHKKSMYCH